MTIVPMELYVLSMHRHLFFVVVFVCCSSILPRSECLDAQYEICQKISTCGSTTISYPFGVANRGCGVPGFQIDCVENSSVVIAIHGRNYTILELLYDNHDFTIMRHENCRFLNESINIGSQYEDTAIRITSIDTWTLNVFNCDTFVQHELESTGAGPVSQCNATVYYASSIPVGFSIRGCTMKEIYVGVGNMDWVFNESTRHACDSCQASGGICGYNISVPSRPFVCYCKDRPRSDKCPHGIEIVAAVGSFIGPAVFIAAALLVGITIYRTRKSLCFRERLVVRGVRDDEGKDMVAAIPAKIGTLPIFSYEILKEATNDFDEKNQLGDGGFGSVYLGKLRDGRAVAVKRLYQVNYNKVLKQFINEVQILSVSYHPNLVRLYGFTSPESRDLLLVYEYIPNGTLADHLHGKRKNDKGLNWHTRLKICLETAQALAFLHSLEPPIFHRDVKSPNILLDEDLHVKVADFGLSRFVPIDATHVSTAPQGTPGYIDPEYYQCFQLTDKSDVYSFGVVLMEIISAKLAVDLNRSSGEPVLAYMAISKIQAGSLHELIDPSLDVDSNSGRKIMVTAVAKLAVRCLAPVNKDRPDMKEVLAELEQIKQHGGPCKHAAFHLPSPTSVERKPLLKINYHSYHI